MDVSKFLEREKKTGMNTSDGYIHNIDIKRKDSRIPPIKKVIFNPPATIVLWGDGTKTVVQCQSDKWHMCFRLCSKVCEVYDREFGLAMCIAKKALGNKGNYYNEFKKWLDNNGNDKNTD
jgi:hypothetical protein